VTRTILVVEDDESIRELLETCFESHGFTVVSARDGAEALLVTTRPQVIALDLSMPVMDGFQFLEHQPKHAQLAGVPVIVLTARPDTELLRGLTPTVRGIVEKPMDLHQLVALASTLCDAPPAPELAAGSSEMTMYVKAAEPATSRRRRRSTPTRQLRLRTSRSAAPRTVLVEQAEALLAALPAVYRAAAAIALPDTDATPAALTDEELRDLLAAAEDLGPRR